MIATERQHSRVGRGLFVLSVVVLVGLLVLVELPLCPSATLFGIPCPGCGLTRATLALLKGDPYRAHQLHPLVLLLAPLYFALLGAAALNYVTGPTEQTGRAWLSGRLATTLAWALFVLVVGVWIARFFGAFGGPVPVRSIVPLGELSQKFQRGAVSDPR